MKPLLRPGKQYPLYPPITDQVTVRHLWERYGDPRCAEIVAGRDESTARDIAAWRNLGKRS